MHMHSTFRSFCKGFSNLPTGIKKFKKIPNDFIFKLSKVELKNWISRFVASNPDKMGFLSSFYID